MNELDRLYGFTEPTIDLSFEPTMDFGDFIVEHLGMSNALFDTELFGMADQFTEGQYRGGSWRMVKFLEGGFAILLNPNDVRYQVTHPLSRMTKEFGSTGLSLVVNAVLFSMKNEKAYYAKQDELNNRLATLYHQCTSAAYKCSDSTNFIRLMD